MTTQTPPTPEEIEALDAYSRTVDALQCELGRTPSRREVADAMHLAIEDVVEIRDAAITAQHVSLDAAIEDAGSEAPLASESSAE